MEEAEDDIEGEDYGPIFGRAKNGFVMIHGRYRLPVSLTQEMLRPDGTLRSISFYFQLLQDPRYTELFEFERENRQTKTSDWYRRLGYDFSVTSQENDEDYVQTFDKDEDPQKWSTTMEANEESFLNNVSCV